MGIINVTPDSFYEGSRKNDEIAWLSIAEKMKADGATIIDVGGQSTRPSSTLLSASEEAARVIPAIETLHHHFPKTIISIDTFYASIAIQAVKAGASIVNDVSGGTFDTDMLSAVGKLHVPFICMHMNGTPQRMQQNVQYEDVSREVLEFLIKQKDACISSGIHDVIIDPGFGFGKTIAHNFELLQRLKIYSILESPLLVGLSRKSTIYKTLGISPSEALNGTTVANTIALLNGANILRVHDVKEAVEAINLVQQYKKTDEWVVTS